MFTPHKKYQRKITLDCGPSLTEQHHKDSVSIHSIMKRYQKTGIIDHVNAYAGTYSDFTNAPDYQDAQNMIADANSMFETVPAYIRKDFENSPQKFLEFIQNPENKTKIEEYGLDASHLHLTDVTQPLSNHVPSPPVSPTAPPVTLETTPSAPNAE